MSMLHSPLFDNASRHKISNDIQGLGKTVNQLDLITAEYTFISSLHGKVMKIEHLLGLKMS